MEEVHYIHKIYKIDLDQENRYPRTINYKNIDVFNYIQIANIIFNYYPAEEVKENKKVFLLPDKNNFKPSVMFKDINQVVKVVRI